MQVTIYGSDKLNIFGIFVETIRFFFKKFSSLAGIALILLLATLTNIYFLQDGITTTVGFSKMGTLVFTRILLWAVTFLITIWVKAALINAVAAQYQRSGFRGRRANGCGGGLWRSGRGASALGLRPWLMFCSFFIFHPLA